MNFVMTCFRKGGKSRKIKVLESARIVPASETTWTLLQNTALFELKPLTF